MNYPMNYPYYGYQGQMMTQAVPDQLSQLRAPQSPPQSGILWVQGEDAAKAYLVAAGNSVLLMDSESNRFYIKSTDASGMPQPLRVFDYTERASARAPAAPAPSEFVTRAEFDALAQKIEALTAPKTETEVIDNG